MKKQRGIIYYGIFFLVALLGELYCLLEYREDVINIVGVGIVLLIAAYLWLDSIMGFYLNRVKEMEDRLERMEKIQKAIYITNKKIMSDK